MPVSVTRRTPIRNPRSAEVGAPVWHAKEGEGYWNPERGNLSLPVGWVFDPPGDVFVTREVKKGTYRVLLKRRKGYTATLGVFCPEANLAGAEKRWDETAEYRAWQRAIGQSLRERAEERYRAELEEAIIDLLGFRLQHAAMAREIARGAVAQATPVGSGRVGRTRRLPLSQRAEFAARTFICHRHTDCEERLAKSSEGTEFSYELEPDDPLYRESRAEAHRHVDDFLAQHR